MADAYTRADWAEKARHAAASLSDAIGMLAGQTERPEAIEVLAQAEEHARQAAAAVAYAHELTWYERDWAAGSSRELSDELRTRRRHAQGLGVRIQLSRAKGWRLPEGAVSVAAPTKWANPHRPKVRGLAANIEAVKAYRNHLREHPELVEAARTELAGRDLACWCPITPSLPCHADVLLDLLETDRARELGTTHFELTRDLSRELVGERSRTA